MNDGLMEGQRCPICGKEAQIMVRPGHIGPVKSQACFSSTGYVFIHDTEIRLGVDCVIQGCTITRSGAVQESTEPDDSLAKDILEQLGPLSLADLKAALKEEKSESEMSKIIDKLLSNPDTELMIRHG